MATTAKEIADRLGLSQPTVSRILSGANGYRVAADTKQRVLEAAKAMDYRPNAVARSLRQRRTNIVGFYSGYAALDTRHDFIAAMVGGLQAACEPTNLDLLLHGVHSARPPEEVYSELVDGRIDGLFFHGALNNPLIAMLATSPLPVIALADPVNNIPSVVADNAAGMSMIVDALWDKGHRCIAFLAPPVMFASVEDRIRAFKRAMASKGASDDQAKILTIPIEDRTVTSMPIEDTKIVMRSILDASNRPTAICCWNDRAAYNLLWRCLKSDISVPNDLAIVGFDGFVENKLPFRSLTTVSVDYGGLAQTALNNMMDLIAGKPIPPLTVLPVKLTAGDTI
jgi:DNA-binding LacI/PurR family transcriptional regulator